MRRRLLVRKRVRPQVQRGLPVRDAVRSMRWTFLLVFRAWHLPTLALAAVVAAVAWLVIPGTAVAVPARDGVSSVIWPLLPALTCSVIPFIVDALRSPAVAASSRRHAAIAGRLLLALLVLLAAANTASVRFDTVIVARNTAILFGFAAVTARYAPSMVAASATVGVPRVMWLFGPDIHGKVHSWAVLLAGRTSWLALVIACAGLVSGAAAILRPPKHASR